MIDKLESFKSKRALVSIWRDNIDNLKIQGFILACSRELILIQYIHDFSIDGVMVIKVSDVTLIESTQIDLFQTEILKDEGVFAKIDFAKTYNVENWKAVFSTIGNECGFVIIEGESPYSPMFILGDLRYVGEDSAAILGFSGAASWDEESSTVYYDTINSFQAGNNYSNVYQRYFDRNALSTMRSCLAKACR